MRSRSVRRPRISPMAAALSNAVGGSDRRASSVEAAAGVSTTPSLPLDMTRDPRYGRLAGRVTASSRVSRCARDDPRDLCATPSCERSMGDGTFDWGDGTEMYRVHMHRLMFFVVGAGLAAVVTGALASAEPVSRSSRTSTPSLSSYLPAGETPAGKNWTLSEGDLSNSRFSTLTQIN